MRLLLSLMSLIVARFVPVFTSSTAGLGAVIAVAIYALCAAILPPGVLRPSHRVQARSAGSFYLAAMTALSVMAPAAFALWHGLSPISVVLISLYYQRRAQRIDSDWGKRHGR